jgi:hypothetical protein
MRQEYAKKSGWTRWIRPVMKGYRMACCDCNLVHELDFRVTKKGRVELRAKRDDKSTKREWRRNAEGRA